MQLVEAAYGYQLALLAARIASAVSELVWPLRDDLWIHQVRRRPRGLIMPRRARTLTPTPTGAHFARSWEEL